MEVKVSKTRLSKNNKISYFTSILLLGATLLCSCNKQHMTAMGLEDSGAPHKTMPKYINWDGGCGETVVNPLLYAQKELEELAKYQIENRNLSSQLKKGKQQLEECEKNLFKEETASKVCSDMMENRDSLVKGLTRQNEDLQNQLKSLREAGEKNQTNCKNELEELRNKAQTDQEECNQTTEQLNKNYQECISQSLGTDNHAQKDLFNGSPFMGAATNRSARWSGQVDPYSVISGTLIGGAVVGAWMWRKHTQAIRNVGRGDGIRQREADETVEEREEQEIRRRREADETVEEKEQEIRRRREADETVEREEQEIRSNTSSRRNHRSLGGDGQSTIESRSGL